MIFGPRTDAKWSTGDLMWTEVTSDKDQSEIS